MIIEVEDKKFRFMRVYNKSGSSKVDTLCFVKFNEYPNIGWAFGGKAKLNPIDKFNKAEGKRVALIHALDNLDTDEESKKLAVDELIYNLPKPPLYQHANIPQ